MLDQLGKEKNTIDSERHVFVKTDGTTFSSNPFKNSIEFASNIYQKDKTSSEDAKNS